MLKSFLCVNTPFSVVAVDVAVPTHALRVSFFLLVSAFCGHFNPAIQMIAVIAKTLSEVGQICVRALCCKRSRSLWLPYRLAQEDFGACRLGAFKWRVKHRV